MWSLHPTGSLMKVFLKKSKLPFEANNSIEARTKNMKPSPSEKICFCLFAESHPLPTWAYIVNMRSKICIPEWKPSILWRICICVVPSQKTSFSIIWDKSPIQGQGLALWWGNNCVCLKLVGLSLIKVWAPVLGLGLSYRLLTPWV